MQWFWVLALGSTSAAVFWFFTQTALDKFFFSNTDYNLARIDVSHPDVLSEAELRHLVGIEEGQNIFLIDLAGVEHELEKVPEILVARVSRRLPDTIEVELKLRSAVAWVKDVSAPAEELPFHLADERGGLYRPRKVLPKHRDLPVIEGVNVAAVQSGDLLITDDLQRALKLVAAAKNHPGLPVSLSRLNIQRGHMFEAELETGTRLLFASEDFTPQLERLARLLQVARQSGRHLEEANLAVRRQTPVRFALSYSGQKSEPLWEGEWSEGFSESGRP